MKKLVLFTFLILSMIACQKQEPLRHPDQLKDETIIEGYVRDPWGMPLPGAVVTCSVLAGKAYQNTWNYWLPAVTTDQNGYYQFHHTDTHEVIGYEVEANLAGYYTPGSRQAQKHWHNIRDFELRPHAWIRVHFKNVDPKGPADLIIWNISSFIPIGASFLGTNIDESWTFKGAGGSESPMVWWVTKDGIKKEYRDTVILPGHDTLHYLLEY